MALIKCEECGGMVSDKAKTCPHCGCPINSTGIETPENVTNTSVSKPEFPEFPAVLNVGKQIVNWGLNAAIQDVMYSYAINNLTYIREGKVTVAAHTNGICISGGLEFLYIHHNQIVDIKCIPYQQFEHQNKSVIGRAVVGGLLLGPLGAIVGGMSGIGTKLKTLGKYALVINFWDVYSHQLQSIMIATSSPVDSFIAKVQSEKDKNSLAEGSNYVINVFKNETELDENKLLDALSETDRAKVTEAILRNGQIPTNEVDSKIQSIAASKNFDMSQVKNTGCMVTAIAIMSSIASITASLVFFIF